MATQMATYLRGKMNNIIFYNVSGKSFARAMPVQVRQTAATKKRSTNFGIAQRAGAVLRSMLQQLLPFAKDKDMQRRFSGAISQWLALGNINTLPPQEELAYISHFSFNPATGIAGRLKVALTITRPATHLLQLELPAFIPTNAITAPAGTAAVQILVKAAACHLQSFAGGCSETVVISFSYNSQPQPARVIDLPIEIAAGDIVLTVMSMRFLDAGGVQDQRPAFMPCAVIDARYC